MQIAILISITGLFIGIVLFLCLLYAFKTGLRLGNNASKGIMPAETKPLKKVIQAVKGQQQDSFIDSLLKGHANMMAFDGETKEEK